MGVNHQLHTQDQTVENEMIQAEFINEIRNVIAKFPRAERERLLMNIDQEMSIDQIADQHNITRKAVEGSLTRARKRLREWFKK